MRPMKSSAIKSSARPSTAVRSPRAIRSSRGFRPPWRKVLLACGAAVFVYATYVHRAEKITPPTIPGWDELISCSHAVSPDGSKELLLSKDHKATLYDKSSVKTEKSNQAKGVLGEWAFDHQSKKYFVSLAGTTKEYTLL